jgi:hypothetical protein
MFMLVARQTETRAALMVVVTVMATVGVVVLQTSE